MNGVWDEGSEMVGEPISKQRATNNNTSCEESYTTIPIKDKKKKPSTTLPFQNICIIWHNLRFVVVFLGFRLLV